MKVRPKRIVTVLLVLVVLAALGMWLARDLPRRKVRSALAERLGAEVTVEGLTILGTRHVRLERLCVSRLQAVPELARACADHVEVHGTLSEVNQGHIERLLLSGVEVTLQRPKTPRNSTATGEVPRIGELELGTVRLVLPGGEVLLATGRLRDVGGTTSGTVRVQGERLSLEACTQVAAVDGATTWPGVALNAPTAELTLDGRSLRLTAGADTAEVVLAGRRIELPASRLAGTATGDGGAHRLRLDAELPWVRQAGMEVDLDTSLAPTHLEATLDGVELGEWLRVAGRPQEGWQADGHAELSAHWTPPQGVGYSVHCTDLAVTGPAGSFSGSLVADGSVGRERDGVLAGPLDLALTAETGELAEPRLGALVLPLEGSFAGRVALTPRPTAGGKVSLRSNALGSLEADATLELGEVPLVDAAWRWSGCDMSSLEAAAASFGAVLPGDVQAAANLAAGGRLSGPPTAPRVAGALRLSELELAVGTTSLRASPSVRFTAEPPYQRLELNVPETALSVRVPPLAPLELGVTATLGVAASLDEGTLERLEITSAELGQLRLSGAWSRQTPAAAHAVAHLPDLGAVASTVAPLLPGAEATLEHFRLGGAAELELDASPAAAGGWTATGTCAVSGGGFASDDGARVADGFGGSWDLALRQDTGGAFAARAEGELSGGLLLWGLVFADFGGRRMDLDLGGTWSDAGPDLEAACSVPGTFSLEGRLGLRDGQPRTWSSRLEVADLAALLESLVQQPLQGSVPALDRLQAAGTLAAHLSGTWHDGGFTAGGRLHLGGVDLTGTGGDFQLRGVGLELPIQLSAMTGGSGELEVSGTPQRGSLRIDELVLRGLRLSTATDLVVRGDTLTLDRTLRVPLLDGELALEQLALDGLLTSRRHLSTAVRFHDLSLRRLTEDLGLPVLEGRLDGSFPKVRLTRDRLEVDGSGQLALFSGTVTVHDIAASDVLSRYPRLRFSAELDGIDLGELTSTFDFGEVTGILAGDIAECEIFRSVPVRCSGHLHTVKEPGVKQTISVRAINNIAIFGTGAGVGLLDRGVHSLLSSYTYESFGLAMQLEQDHFLLRGLEQRGDRELFLKGKLPFRIDVVNVQPGTAVSFRTLVRRLRNLDLAGVSTGAPPRR